MKRNENFFRHNTDIGQNFLRDRSVVEWMTRRAALGPDDRVLEIGPGEGALTGGILSTPCASLDAVELDVRLRERLAPLEADARLRLHWGDAVKFDYGTLENIPTHIIANLPYHITTPVIWRLLEFFSGRGMRYMLMMLQYEAAVRIASGAGSRESSPLGITVSALGNAEVARRVSRGAFHPQPRVDSAIVEIRLSGENADLPRDKNWRRLLTGSFAQRRKTLVNNWGASFGTSRPLAEEILSSLDKPKTLRPEEATLADWLAFHACFNHAAQA